MSKRLQVVLADEELERFRKAAQVQRMTLSEWARQTLRRAERDVATGDVERRLAILEWASDLNLGPEVGIEQMLAEIETGYLGEPGGDGGLA